MSASSRETATMGGISMKYISLVTLTIQNSALILVMRYSRIMPLVDGKRYYPSTAVLLNELLKLAISSSFVIASSSASSDSSGSPTAGGFVASARRFFGSLRTGDSLKLAIPAALYTIQNTLQYVAVSNLDAATFQVTYQLKILTTALFSVTMLGRVLSVRKWISLVLLMAGVAIVQLPAPSGTGTGGPPPPGSAQPGAGAGETGDKVARMVDHLFPRSTEAAAGGNSMLGLIAVMIACAISGLAGVYFEKVLKDSSKNVSLWVRNVQLSFFSLFPAFFLGVLGTDGQAIRENGFFTGYNWVVWTAIAFQAVGGIIVALVVNYADNIAKNFATSLSIILSFIASVYFFGLEITLQYLVGTAVVLYATYLYSSPEKSAAPSGYARAPTTDEEAGLEMSSPSRQKGVLDEDKASPFSPHSADRSGSSSQATTPKEYV